MSRFGHGDRCYFCLEDYVQDKFITCKQCTSTICIKCFKNGTDVCFYGHLDKNKHLRIVLLKISMGILLFILLFSLWIKQLNHMHQRSVLTYEQLKYSSREYKILPYEIDEWSSYKYCANYKESKIEICAD